MRVYHDRQIDSVLDGRNKVVSVFGREKTGHIFNANGRHTHGLQFLHELHVFRECVYRRGGIGDRTGGDRPGLDCLLNGDLQVLRVVERVKDPDDVDAVTDARADKAAHDIVAVVFVTKDVLAPQEHLQPGVGHGRADLAQPLPGIFMQKAEAHVKRGAAPAFDRIITRLVDGLQDRLELVVAHACGHQRLTGVAQDRFGKLDFFHRYTLSYIVVNYLYESVYGKTTRQSTRFRRLNRDRGIFFSIISHQTILAQLLFYR